MLRRQPKHKKLADFLTIERKLNRHRELRQLVQQADALANQEQRVLALLPAKLQAQFKLIGVTEHTLQLQCHSAAFATRLRMQQRSLLENVSRQLRRPVTELQILIRPETHTARQNTRPALKISHENAQALLQEAGQTGDPALKAVLERIAAHANDAP